MNFVNEAFTVVSALSCSDITDAIHCMVIEFAEEVQNND